MGPNSDLHRNNPAQSPRKISAGLVTPQPSPPPCSILQPTLPAGPPSTANLILTLVNASVQAIHEANFTLLGEC